MQNQIPLTSLPNGSVLATTIYYGGIPFPHSGIIERTWKGPVVHQNSKKLGRAVTTSFEEFTEGNPAQVTYIPQSAAEGSLIVRRALNDVARGIPWTVVDNCEDLVSRAVTGRNGSPTRKALVGVGLFGLALFFASRA
ncbi:MAG: hypothetical protein HY234_14910 [Acidobacteria bacterium]|nr:hypothetical protein [Acidobacteriota bacterium]